MAQFIKKRFGKIAGWTAISLVSVLFLFVIALQLPAVQTLLVDRVSSYLSRKTGFPVSVDKVNIHWFNEASLKNLRVFDNHGDEMIYADLVLLEYKFRDLIQKDQKIINEAVLRSASVNLTRYPGDSAINITRFINNMRSAFGGSGGKKSDFRIETIRLANSSFRLNDYRRDSVEHRFDPSHFEFHALSGVFADFTIRSDTLGFSARELKANLRGHDLEIIELNTNFLYSRSRMLFGALSLETGESMITDSLAFAYSGPKSLSSFIDSVSVHASFSESVISTNDLMVFGPEMNLPNQQFMLDGEFRGQISDFNLRNFSLGYGNSLLRGNFTFSGLPSFQETFIDAGIGNSRIESSDLVALLGDNNLYRRFDWINFRGQFLGFPNDFVANGVVQSNLGRLEPVDLNLKFNDPENIYYRGRLTTHDFDLGRFLMDTVAFQKLNMTGFIEGTGTGVANADLILNGSIESIGIKDYDYQNIISDARFTNRFVDGYMRIDDPNLKFEARGSLDLREGRNSIEVTGRLDTAKFHMMKLTSVEAGASGDLSMDIQGLHIDSLIGSAEIRNARLYYDGRIDDVDSLIFYSQKRGDYRSLNVTSDNIDASINGDFLFSRIFDDLQQLAREYQLNVLNDSAAINEYYASKSPDIPEKYLADFNFKLRDINPFLQLFLPQISLSYNSEFEGRFIGGQTGIFSVFGRFDSLQYANQLFTGNLIDISASKKYDSLDVLASIYFQSDKQSFNRNTLTENLFFEGIWNRQHIDFDAGIDQQNSTNTALIKGALDFLPGSTRIALEPSEVKIFDQIWTFDPDNSIVFAGKEVRFNQFVLSSGRQSLSAIGSLSEDHSRELDLRATSFSLTNLNPIINREIEGVVSASMKIRNFYLDRLIESDFDVRELKLDQILIGNILGASKGSADNDFFTLEFSIERSGRKVIDILGEYYPFREDDQLSLDVVMDDANLDLAQPFVSSYFSELNGSLTGSIRITGRVSEPNVEGMIRIPDGHFKINYLNTAYDFGTRLFLDDNEIEIRNLKLNDEERSSALFNGGFTHSGFRDFQIDLTGQMNNLMVLNTASGDNDLFYGKGKVSGTVNLKGPIQNMVISANAKTERDTRIFIPIQGGTDVVQEDFISFINFTGDTLVSSTVVEEEPEIKFGGLTLDLDLEVTDDAYGEIIFDIQAGDIIRGRGNGQLDVLVNTNGEFTMFGDIEFTQGGYNFTMYNIINKEFNVLPKSKISWFGDPYGGILDIQANYRQFVAIDPLFSEQSESFYNHPDIRRKYPTSVLLDLKGPLMSPDISFDIDVEDLPETIIVEGVSYDLETTFLTLKNRLESDEQELNRQVFSLIILRRFSPENEFIAQGTIGRSVSEFVSNQLSYWISQVDENLEIDVDLGSLDDEAFNTFQLRLAYTFLDGRLRISREGGFTGNNSTNVDISDIVGDWTLEYLLTPDGKFRVKMYNRTKTNTMVSELENSAQTVAGFSLLHTQSFNEIRELLSTARRKQREENNQKDSNKEARLEDEDDPDSQ